MISWYFQCFQSFWIIPDLCFDGSLAQDTVWNESLNLLPYIHPSTWGNNRMGGIAGSSCQSIAGAFTCWASSLSGHSSKTHTKLLSCPQDEQDDTNLWKPCWSGGRRKRTTNTIRIRKMIVSTTTIITTTSGNDYFNIDQTSNWGDGSCLMWWIWCCQVRSKDRSWGSRLRQKPAREMSSCRVVLKMMM